MRVVPNRRGAYNNAFERTRRVGVPAAQAVVGVPPCRSTQCSTETAGSTATAKEDGLVPWSSSARSDSPHRPVAGRYGWRLLASAPIPAGSGAWSASASVAKRQHLLQANVILSNSFSAQQGSSARAWLRLQQNRNATVPQNNGLKRTSSRFSLPACRLIRCYPDLE